MTPRQILVRAPNWIGDQVLAYPFFHHLRAAYPKARIRVVCVEWVKDIQFRGLVDEVFTLPRLVQGTLLEKFRVLEDSARALRKDGPWDLAISLPNSFSAAWLLYRSGAKIRRGYAEDGRGLLLNDSLPWEPSSERHRAQAYVDLLPKGAKDLPPAKEFWGIPPENDLDPGTTGVLSSFDQKKHWPSAESLKIPSEPFWVLAPGATAESRRWPTENFVALARTIARETGWKGVVVGGPKEAPLAEQLCADPDLKLVDLTAQGPVTGLHSVFSKARFTVCNESGLAHVAALCGSPTQIVCGAADPRRTRPIGPGRVQVAINPVDCWPCERNTCSQPPDRKIQCLTGIQSDAVWEDIKRGLRL